MKPTSRAPHPERTTKPDRLAPVLHSVLLDLTNVCQYRCRFCWYHGDERLRFLRTVKNKPFFFPTKPLEGIIDDLKTFRPLTITLTSEGDPMLHPGIEAIIRRIHSTGARLIVQTNGAFPGRLVPSVALCDEVHVNLSFPSTQALRELNPGLRPDLAPVRENIKALLKKERRPQLVGVYILTRHDAVRIDKVIAHLNRAGIDSVQFKPCEVVAGINDDLAPTRSEARAIARQLLSLRTTCQFRHNIVETARDMTKHYVGTDHFKNNPPLPGAASGWTRWRKSSPQASSIESDYIWRSPDLTACAAPLSYLYIRLNGDVFTCARNSWLDPVGNVFKTRLRTILKSPRYQKALTDGMTAFDINAPRWRRCKNCFLPRAQNPQLAT